MLLCLVHMPYGYYTFVRFAAMVIFAITCIYYATQEQIPLAVTAGALALLFQPLVKFSLGRTIWNIVDVLVALALIALFVYEMQPRKR